MGECTALSDKKRPISVVNPPPLVAYNVDYKKPLFHVEHLAHVFPIVPRGTLMQAFL